MSYTGEVYKKEKHESIDEFMNRVFDDIAKAVEIQEETHQNSPVSDTWSETFEATDENLNMLKNDDIIRINKNDPGMVWGSFKELFVESGFLAFQILMKKQKAEHYFFLNTEEGRPSYLGKFHYTDEAYEQACIVHPDDDGVVTTIDRISTILYQMELMIKD